MQQNFNNIVKTPFFILSEKPKKVYCDELEMNLETTERLEIFLSRDSL